MYPHVSPLHIPCHSPIVSLSTGHQARPSAALSQLTPSSGPKHFPPKNYGSPRPFSLVGSVPPFRTHLTPHPIHPSPLRVVARSRLRQSSQLLQRAPVADNFLQTRAFLTHAAIPILRSSLSYSLISPRWCYASPAPPVTCQPKRFSPSHEERHPSQHRFLGDPKQSSTYRSINPIAL